MTNVTAARPWNACTPGFHDWYFVPQAGFGVEPSSGLRPAEGRHVAVKFSSVFFCSSAGTHALPRG